MPQRNLRFVGFRSAGEIGIDVFVRESRELLLLMKKLVETQIHCYVQYTQWEGGWEVEGYVRERKSDASDLNESGSHQRGHGKSKSRYFGGKPVFQVEQLFCWIRKSSTLMGRLHPTFTMRVKGALRVHAGSERKNKEARSAQTSAEGPSRAPPLRKRYSEPYKLADPIVARVKPTATGCRGAASVFLAFRKR